LGAYEEEVPGVSDVKAPGGFEYPLGPFLI